MNYNPLLLKQLTPQEFLFLAYKCLTYATPVRCVCELLAGNPPAVNLKSGKGCRLRAGMDFDVVSPKAVFHPTKCLRSAASSPKGRNIGFGLDLSSILEGAKVDHLKEMRLAFKREHIKAPERYGF